VQLDELLAVCRAAHENAERNEPESQLIPVVRGAAGRKDRSKVSLGGENQLEDVRFLQHYPTEAARVALPGFLWAAAKQGDDDQEHSRADASEVAGGDIRASLNEPHLLLRRLVRSFIYFL